MTRGGQRSLKIYLSKAVLLTQKISRAKVESNGKYVCLSKSKQVVQDKIA